VGFTHLLKLNNPFNERNKMEDENNVISMKEVKNKKKQSLVKSQPPTLEEEKDWKKEIGDIQEKLNKKDYILTIYQIGDEGLMSGGDYDRQVECRRYFDVCSLLDIQQYIEKMKTGFWVPREEGWSKKELSSVYGKKLKNYPHEKKKFGKFWNIVIEPLSKELEDSYIDPKSRKFFQGWRDMLDEGLV